MKKEVKIGFIIQLFANLAVFTPQLFIPQLAEKLHATQFEIGLLATLFSLFLFISSYLSGRIADRIGRRKIITIGFAASIFSYALGYFAMNYKNLLFVRILQGATIGIYPGALAAYVYENKGKMGKFSSFGATGSAISQYISGIIVTFLGLHWLFIVSSLSFLVSLTFVVFGLREEEYKPVYVSILPINVIKRNKGIYIALFLRHTGATGIWAFWVLYLGQIGANNYWKGILFTFNYVTQALVMYLIMDKVSGKRSVGWGLILSSLIFLSFAFVPNYLWIIPTMIATGFAWSFLYTGALKEVTEKNKERATASGLIQSSISLGSILGPLIGGIIVTLTHTYKGVMYFAFLITLIAYIYYLLQEKMSLRHSDSLEP